MHLRTGGIEFVHHFDVPGDELQIMRFVGSRFAFQFRCFLSADAVIGN
jgi:hypothetical protein